MINLSIFTVTFAVLSLACGTTLLVLVWLDNRKTGLDAGITNFRRHIDALSPEARRSSISIRTPDNDGRRR